MTNHLFLFTLGPVQSFIAQARKTRDLYAGSQILSALVAEGIEAFKSQFPEGVVVFPSEHKLNLASLPNRFIAKVKANEAELKTKVDVIEKAVLAAWKKMADDAALKAKANMTESQQYAFDNQIRSLLDIHWVFKKIEGSDEFAYATAYEELERLGGAIKNIRDFHQIPEQGRKCSLDGANNALFCNSKNKGNWHKWNDPVEIRGFSIGETEGLSTISLTKRFYPVDDKFPSTAHVSLMRDIQNLSPENKKRLQCFENLFKIEHIADTCVTMFSNGFVEKATITNPDEYDDWNTDWDEHFLFEENLEKITNPEQRGLLVKLQKELKKDLKTRYYAIVLFDGDKMGEWLSGNNNITKENLEKFHTELSGTLASFGKVAKEYLNREKGNGQTVYAGGDDFMGFVNIHHLFDVMKHLRKRFDEIVNQGVSAFKKEDKNLTFSAGIVIAHYKMPFSEVLKKARAVEKAAKNEGGRNAFGIAVMKHSGEIQQALYKWGQDENSPPGCLNWEALEKIYKELDKREEYRDKDKSGGNFSNTFIQNLTVEIMGLTGVDMGNLSPDGHGRTVNDKMPVEIKRLVAKSWKEGQKRDDVKIVALSDEVVQLWKEVPKDSDYRPRNFIHALHIADFLTRKITQEK